MRDLVCKVLVDDRGVPCACAVKVPSGRPQYFYAGGSTEYLERCSANFFRAMRPSPRHHLIVGELDPYWLAELPDWTCLAVLAQMEIAAYRGADGRFATKEVTQLAVLPPGPCRMGWVLDQMQERKRESGIQKGRKAASKKPRKTGR